MRRILMGLGLLLALAAAAPIATPASAQPFNAWAISEGDPAVGFVQIPHHPALHPSTGFTFEAWVLLDAPCVAMQCRSLAGKGYGTAWAVLVCNTDQGWVLRSYLQGEAFQVGMVPLGQWTHLAVTWDNAGDTQRHFINGEEVGAKALFGPLEVFTSNPVRLLSDPEWAFSPDGALDEVRLWNVRRTQAQIRETINVRIDTAQPGLVAVWALDGNANDVIGARDGVTMGLGIHFLIGAVASDCGSQTATHFCFATRFQASARYRVGPPGSLEQQAQTIPCAGAGLCDNSGIFWFFQDENWELMLKVLNGCSITHHWWVFNAGLTNVFFRLEVTDVQTGRTKIYFNYPGPPAPAIADTLAFDICPP
jgi:Concanavalin A-like lectin/glucanases superfamily